ncbi:MAG: 3-oxoacyl-ACP reductase [Planctomycetes bacterium]|nr:3-oxoacyl-ACP reductase [Planctomycetota bacterium]
MSSWASYPSLEGATVLVTGGASGIGASLVRHFGAQGSRVGLIDLQEDAGAALVEELRGRGQEARFAAVDLRDITALRAAIDEIVGALGPVGVLVNNAADDTRHAFAEVTPEYFDDRIATNLRHQFFAAQAVAPGMVAAGGGAIVNMGSITWLLGQSDLPVYTTSKAAVTGMTRALARELGPKGIRVNAVLPGAIMTERQIRLWKTPEYEAQVMSGQCLQRFLEPDEVARLVLFLASDDGSGCTGQDYLIDGGWA